jgi:hypothetical protein
VTLDGYRVAGVARLVGYRFSPGDGSMVTSTRPGSKANPAATHLYDVKGTYELQAASVWQADVTMTGPGLSTPVPVTIGTAVVSATRSYRVVEVRSTLLP